MALKSKHKILLSIILTIRTSMLLFEDDDIENNKTKIDESYWVFI